MVCHCNSCKRFISISLIPGGNPVALADPATWATSYVQCPVCGKPYCDQCASRDPLCPKCEGPRELATREQQIQNLIKLCDGFNSGGYSWSDLINAGWGCAGLSYSQGGKIKELRESLPVVTFETLARAANSVLHKYADSESVEFWGMSRFYWQPGTPDETPISFIKELAEAATKT